MKVLLFLVCVCFFLPILASSSDVYIKNGEVVSKEEFFASSAGTGDEEDSGSSDSEGDSDDTLPEEVPLEIGEDEESEGSEEEGDLDLPAETESIEEPSSVPAETKEGEGEKNSDPLVDSEDGLDVGVPEEVPLENAPESVCQSSAERELIKQIQGIAEDARSEERGFDASLIFGYKSHGLDPMILEYFFSSPITSQEVFISHPSGLYFVATNLISFEGGLSSDRGDRTNLSFGLQGDYRFLNWQVQHQWVHTNHRADEWFYYADRHRTSFHLEATLGPLTPYVFFLSDVPAYTPMDEWIAYGGGGAVLTLPIEVLKTDVTIGASFVSSLLRYYRNERNLYRVHAGFNTNLGGLSIHPEVTYVADVATGGSMIVTSFEITF